MNRSKGSSSRRTFLRLAALLLPAGALLGSLPGVRAAARPRKLYLAGPDVFRADAVAHGEALKALCARYGFEGLYPLDNALPKQLAEPREQAAWIYRANIGLIERADAVLANLNFFRGAEPDSGTAFEVGYATALGKPVYGYVDDAGSYAERIRRHAPELI
ncbi:nucleoside 2-deoxyribosyltransferase, partial [Pseudomonas aeruginosa]